MNLLLSLANEVPMDAGPPATADERAVPEAEVPPTKEGPASPDSVSWYLQKKWWIPMLVIVITVLAIVIVSVVHTTR